MKRLQRFQALFLFFTVKLPGLTRHGLLFCGLHQFQRMWFQTVGRWDRCGKEGRVQTGVRANIAALP